MDITRCFCNNCHQYSALWHLHGLIDCKLWFYFRFSSLFQDIGSFIVYIEFVIGLDFPFQISISTIYL